MATSTNCHKAVAHRWLAAAGVVGVILAGVLYAACAASGGRTGTLESQIAAAAVVAGDQAAGDVDKSWTAAVTGGDGDSVTSMLLAASALCGALGGGGAYPFIRKLRIRMAGDPLATLRNRVEILERLARKDGHL